MKTYTVSFFGHRRIYDQIPLERKLEDLLRYLLNKMSYVEFLVGRNGDFDQIVSSTINRIKRQYRSDNSSHVWVMPYLTADYRNNEKAYLEYYDEVEVCDASSATHYRSAIQIRNRCMVDRSDLSIFFVNEKRGGAYETMKYAIKTGAKYINLYTSELRDKK